MPKAKLPFKKYKWTPELAYAVGLLVTDGNLSKDGRHITMRSVDMDLMKTFKKCLNLNSKIGFTPYTSYRDGYQRKLCHRVQFGDVQFYNWLVSIGITPAKSKTIGAIKIPDTYFRDFLRGHLDGDGTILHYQDRYNHYRDRTYNNLRVYVNFISASYEHMAWLRKKIEKLASVHGAFFQDKSTVGNRTPISHVRFAKKESVKLLNWIYYQLDLPCLRRKRGKAEEALKLITNKKRYSHARFLQETGNKALSVIN